jgi:hypothetical protein
MTTPKTTAVDWLISKLPKLPPDIIPDEEWFGIIGEAREMQRNDATAFAEWLYRNRWFHFEDGKWSYTFEMGTVMSKEAYEKNYRKTTAELYEIYYNETYGKSE